MTRAQCLALARLYAEWPNTTTGDTYAYLLLDEVERTMYQQVVDCNPSLFWVLASKTYTANAEYLTLNNGTSALFYKIVALGKPADSGSTAYYNELYQPTSWAELDDPQADATTEASYRWHFDGAALRLRPIPTTDLTLRIRYLPFHIPGTSTTSALWVGNYIMQQFGDLCAMRLAARLLAVRSGNVANIFQVAAPAEQAFKQFLGTLQDQAPVQIDGTSRYSIGQGYPSGDSV